MISICLLFYVLMTKRNLSNQCNLRSWFTAVWWYRKNRDFLAFVFLSSLKDSYFLFLLYCALLCSVGYFLPQYSTVFLSVWCWLPAVKPCTTSPPLSLESLGLVRVSFKHWVCPHIHTYTQMLSVSKPNSRCKCVCVCVSHTDIEHTMLVTKQLFSP